MPSLASCPNCDYPLPAGRHALCPNCQYPIILDHEDDSRQAYAHEGLTKPTTHAPVDETTLHPVVDGPRPRTAPITAPGHACPQCGQHNDLTRRRCERCAADLSEDGPDLLQFPEPSPPRRRRSGVLLIILVVLLGLLAGALVYAFMASGGQAAPPESPSSTVVKSNTSTRTQVRRVPAANITASASSELASADGRFSVAQTLDGNQSTVWNSDGTPVSPTSEITLTYTFDEPVNLQAILLYNGSQKSAQSFADNGRANHVEISNGTSVHAADLVDARGAQTISHEWGSTSEVTITIISDFRDETTKFKELAISDVVFLAS